MSGLNQAGTLSRDVLRKLAKETLQAIEAGSYAFKSHSPTGDSRYETVDLRASVERLKKDTTYHGPDTLSSWSQPKPDTLKAPAVPLHKVRIRVVEKTTVEAAQWLHDKLRSPSTVPSGRETRAHAKIGVLSFASAKRPGGGFLNGAQAQEESIARSSTLYPSLVSSTAQQFYIHNHSLTYGKNDGYYSHAMIYSPAVLIIRDDHGKWVSSYEVDVITSPAVNAGVVRQKRQQALERREKTKSEAETEEMIRAVMRERMARVLYLFEMRGVRNLVLGSFGTGVFKNKVKMVVDLWAELLVGKNARFAGSFETVVFGVFGHGTHGLYAEKFGTEER